ncbi:hypothetical protein J8273_5148 [Carpediemonas membranifera]|uniref:Uncharacterized protein n=1 Tax=Carpediemonas membranifera TaxID=201153 RepID=A0A8J6E2Q1_9EUKA|nr:hypothetical protein J8273_5148 [Carpediemonas membranifera]|eukprot:KAG9392167.1 hypothetical protein J8273_5148 [Carpediemonas membranifera]
MAAGSAATEKRSASVLDSRELYLHVPWYSDVVRILWLLATSFFNSIISTRSPKFEGFHLPVYQCYYMFLTHQVLVITYLFKRLVASHPSLSSRVNRAIERGELYITAVTFSYGVTVLSFIVLYWPNRWSHEQWICHFPPVIVGYVLHKQAVARPVNSSVRSWAPGLAMILAGLFYRAICGGDIEFAYRIPFKNPDGDFVWPACALFSAWISWSLMRQRGAGTVVEQVMHVELADCKTK